MLGKQRGRDNQYILAHYISRRLYSFWYKDLIVLSQRNELLRRASSNCSGRCICIAISKDASAIINNAASLGESRGNFAEYRGGLMRMDAHQGRNGCAKIGKIYVAKRRSHRNLKSDYVLDSKSNVLRTRALFRCIKFWI